MTKELEHLVYGLTDVQLHWSRYKIRLVLNAKWPAKKAKNYFYTELLRRKK